MKRIALTCLAAAALLATSCNKPPAGTEKATTSDAVEPAVAPAPAEAANTAAAPEPAGEPMHLELTDNTEFEWTGYKIVGQHSGSFLLYEGAVDLPAGTLDSAQFNVTIETMSVITDDDTLTKVVQNNQFFDCNNYPEMTFVSTGIEKEGDKYWVTGNLTIRDITKSIRFPAEMTLDGDTFSLSSSFTINRRDWKIIYDGIGDNVLKDEVLIALDVEAEKTADAP